MYKKILFVSRLYPSIEQPQYCIFIEQQAKYMEKLGNKVDVIVPQYSNTYKINMNKTIISGMNVTYIDFPVYWHGLFSSIAIKLFILFITKNINFNDYDIISLHMFDEHILKAFVEISKIYNLKIVTHYHGLNVGYERDMSAIRQIIQRRGNKIYKKLLKEVDAIVGVSDKVCKEIKKIYENNIIVTIYNGVDTDKFFPAISNNNDSNINILCVGNLIPTKGQEYLLIAFSELVNNHKDKKILLNIVGKGENLERLKQLSIKLNIENKVYFHGSVLYDQVATMMREADIFILPSYYEALGCVYLEAMASRIVTIGCKGQGIDEIIIDNKNGFLIEGEDSNSILDTLNYLVEHKEERDLIANEGYKLIKDNYTWKKSSENLNELYNSLLKNNKCQY